LAELKAQPRKETLDVAEAQVVSAQAALKTGHRWIPLAAVAFGPSGQPPLQQRFQEPP